MAIISKKNRELYDLGENDFLVEFDLINPTNTDVTYDLFNTTTLSLVPTSPTSNIQLPPSFVSFISPLVTDDGLAHNPLSNTVYALNNSNILVVNSTLNSIITTISIGGGSSLRTIVYNNISNTMYVTDFNNNNVYVIDCNTNTLVATIPVGVNPSGIAYNSTNNTVYVCDTTSNTVSVIDCNTNLVIATIAVGTFPFDIAFNSSTNRIYVTNNSSNNISVIDCNTNTVVNTIAIAVAPRFIAYSTSNNSMYIGISVINSVARLDCATDTFVGAPIAVGDITRNILYLASFNLIYVNTTASGTFVIDCNTNTIVNNIAVGVTPVAIAYNNINNFIYIPRDGGVGISLISSLSAPPIPYITGSFNYNEFIQDVINNPVCVERLVLVSQNTKNFNQVINVVSKDANGTECQLPFIPSLSVGMNQFQSGIGKVDFLDNCLVLGVNQYFSNFINAANSIVKVLLIYKQLEKSKLLTDKKGMVGRLDFNCNPIKEYKPTKDAPAFDYFQKVDKPKIRPFSPKQVLSLVEDVKKETKKQDNVKVRL